MNGPVRYKTVAGQGVAEIEEKKSKFIAHIFPVTNEEEAAENISFIRKKHYSATHNVFAFSIGQNGERTKASDDGEPSGTAGMPVLDILRHEHITNVLIVVTRYFGGTLLGAGGLVRAYSKAAKEGLNCAGIITRTLCTKYELTVEYGIYGKIQYVAETECFKILDTVYTDVVMFIFIIEIERIEHFINIITDICRGCELLEKIETDYYDL